MGLKVHRDGFKSDNSLEWRSAVAVASVRERLMFTCWFN